MLVMRFLSLGQQKPFVDVMINEIPGQDLVLGVMTRDVEIGIGKQAAIARLALQRAERPPDGTRVAAVPLAHPFENRADAAVAARHQGLKLCCARRFGVEFYRTADSA